jgi:hypothetical protein
MRLLMCCRIPPEDRVPSWFSLSRLRRSVEATRHRKLRTEVTEDGVAWATMSLSAPGYDWVIYRRPCTEERDIQLFVHQVAHLLLGHRGAALASPMLGSLLFPPLDDYLTREFIPGDYNTAVVTGDEDDEAVALAREIFRHGKLPPPAATSGMFLQSRFAA